MAVWEFVQLALTITITYSLASQSCGNRTFHHLESLDGHLFSDTFISQRNVSDKVACLWWCFHDLQCNMVLHNLGSQRCRLYYSSVISGGVQEADWQYYTVACSDFRDRNALLVMRNQTHVNLTCSSGFSYLPTPSGKCFHDNEPLDMGRCMQTLWIDPVPILKTPLPAPLSTGAEIIVEAAADGVMTRREGWNGTGDTDGTGDGTGQENGTGEKISGIDNSVLKAPRRLPLQEADTLQINFTADLELPLQPKIGKSGYYICVIVLPQVRAQHPGRLDFREYPVKLYGTG
ncbi:uncharacterized protein [Haliotis asinina]|uniref:uncharacterized protein n=1 Tax=Haliotis asinina TaxID=109174 RepID=UPI003531CF11